MGKTSLMPPGFRFHPTDVELVMFYLKRKVLRKRLGFEAIAVVDIYKFTPWDLPDKSALKTGDLKWYFFCPVEKKYSNGARMNRATEIGYWKTTGKDRPVNHVEELVGWIKTLVFHTGKAPKGERTNWVMHEYRLEDKNLPETAVVQNNYVLCMIFKKDGLGPRNGAQYGAPFKEEDYEEIDSVEAGPSAAGLSISTHVLPSNCSNSVITGTSVRCGRVSESDLCETILSECKRLKATCSNDVPEYQVPSESDNLPAVLGNNHELISDPKYQVPSENDILPAVQPVLPPNEELLSMFDSFTEDDTLVSNEDDKTKKLCHDGNPEGTKNDGSDIYEDLVDLYHLDGDQDVGFSLANCFNISDLDQLPFQFAGS